MDQLLLFSNFPSWLNYTFNRYLVIKKNIPFPTQVWASVCVPLTASETFDVAWCSRGRPLCLVAGCTAGTAPACPGAITPRAPMTPADTTTYHKELRLYRSDERTESTLAMQALTTFQNHGFLGRKWTW